MYALHHVAINNKQLTLMKQKPHFTDTLAVTLTVTSLDEREKPVLYSLLVYIEHNPDHALLFTARAITRWGSVG